jgi:hypothetical protein
MLQRTYRANVAYVPKPAIHIAIPTPGVVPPRRRAYIAISANKGGLFFGVAFFVFEAKELSP